MVEGGEGYGVDGDPYSVGDRLMDAVVEMGVARVVVTMVVIMVFWLG